MGSLHSEIKCLINQYLHTCEELKFQDGGQYGRQNTDRSISQLIGQLQRQIWSYVTIQDGGQYGRQNTLRSIYQAIGQLQRQISG